MEESRKQIIIKEIIHWKNNRLLPEHYCDFLLALYTEGNTSDSVEKNKDGSSNKLLYLLTFIPIALFLLYFTELSLILQMVFAIILMISGIFLSVLFYKKNLFFQFPLVLLAFITLFISVDTTLTLFPSNNLSMYFALGINILIWFIVGWKLKQLYFSISGILGLIMLVIALFL